MLMRTGQLRSVIVVRSKCQANALDGFEPSKNVYEPVGGLPPLFRRLIPSFAETLASLVGWLVETQKRIAEMVSPSQTCTGILTWHHLAL